MPIARITLLEGVDEARRGRVIEAVTQALVDTLDAPPEAVRVLRSCPRQTGASGADQSRNGRPRNHDCAFVETDHGG